MYLYIACRSTNVEGRGILEYNPLHHIHHSSMYNRIVCSAHLLSSLNHITIKQFVNVSELACEWKMRGSLKKVVV